jgi:hypothetical protein
MEPIEAGFARAVEPHQCDAMPLTITDSSATIEIVARKSAGTTSEARNFAAKFR